MIKLKKILENRIYHRGKKEKGRDWTFLPSAEYWYDEYSGDFAKGIKTNKTWPDEPYSIDKKIISKVDPKKWISVFNKLDKDDKKFVKNKLDSYKIKIRWDLK